MLKNLLVFLVVFLAGTAPLKDTIAITPINIYSDNGRTMLKSLSERGVDNNLYYQQLTDDQKVLYGIFYDMAQNYDNLAVIEGLCNEEDMLRAVHAFCYEHPEFFWVTPQLKYYCYDGDSSRISKIEFKTDTTLEERKHIDARLNAIADEAIAQIVADNHTDREVFRATHDYVIDITEYSRYALCSWDIRSVLLNHEALCTGYARTFQYLLNRMGYECYFVTGTADNTEEIEGHAWNIVTYDNDYYFVDTTWDESSGYTYFMNNNNFLSNHWLNEDEFVIIGE